MEEMSAMTILRENHSVLNNSGQIKSGSNKARNYRALAVECERQAVLAFEEPQFRAMQRRLARSYLALAESEDWLDGIVKPEQNGRTPLGAA
jgi:hypothetical protein